MQEEQVRTMGEVSIVRGADALEAIDRAAIDVQITTAKAYPRSIERAKSEALALATTDEDTAASMVYAIPRDGKMVEGPSIRLAEIVSYSWGNLRVQGVITAIEEKRVVALGTALDLERNHAEQVEIPRSIWGKKGRFSPDMINVTSRAAVAIARREAILAVIPRVFIKPIEAAARKKALGEGGQVEQNRQKALAWFAKLGVDAERICNTLRIGAVEQIGNEQLLHLLAIRTAIQDGEVTIEEAFPRPGAEPGQTDDLNTKLAEKKAVGNGKKKPAEAVEEEPVDPEEVGKLEVRYGELQEIVHPDWDEKQWAGWEKLFVDDPGDKTAADFGKLIARLEGTLAEAKATATA